VNFGFLGYFDAANPIIAARRWTFKVFLEMSFSFSWQKYLNKGNQYAVNILPEACTLQEL